MKVGIPLFFGKYRYLSNFYISPFIYNDTEYLSVEHAYQSLKLKNKSQREIVREAKTPKDAKRLGGKYPLRKDFEQIKNNIMYKMVCEKFRQNKNLAYRLGETSGLIIEGNTWCDNYWGNCVCPDCRDFDGDNHLGRMLMQIRKKIQQGTL